MKLKIFLIVQISIFFLSANLIAQDSTKTGWEWDWEFEEFDEWINIWKKQPAISLQYGFSNIDHKNISSKFINPKLAELQLGYIKKGASTYADYLLKFSYRYSYISFISADLGSSKPEEGKINSKAWRFGFSRSGGYGYKFGDAAILPYHTYSIDWSRVNFINPLLIPDEQYRLKRFDESFRFGTSNEGGIRIALTDYISLDASYQRSVVFERHLFWKWAGSAIIEFAGQGLLDAFIGEILESSPAAGPIVYFILKNALGYGLYELRQEKMNWPFTGAAPLSFDSFKFGLSITF